MGRKKSAQSSSEQNSDASKNNSSIKKSKVLKNYKQIILNERSLQWSEQDADYTYSSIDALPSFKPQKKYSDISGIPALYTDPHSKLRYANAEEFLRIKNLPSDIISGLLNLRKANGCSS